MITFVALSGISLDGNLYTLITLVIIQLPVLFWLWLDDRREKKANGE